MTDSMDAAVGDTIADSLLNFAQIDLEGMAVVIRADCVLHALARPAALTRLPRSHAAIDGVFSYQGQMIPLVDLRNWLAPDRQQEQPLPYVMLLGTQGRVIGLAVSAVHGMLRIPGAHVRRIYRDNAADRFFQNVVRSEKDDCLYSELDPLCLMTQVEAWAEATSDIASAAGMPDVRARSAAQNAVQSRTPAQVLVRSGTTVLAIPAAHVGEVLNMPSVDSIFSLADTLSGLTRWHGIAVAVLDLMRLLGQERAALPAPLLLMLTDGSLRAGLPVDEILAVRSFAVTAVETATHADPGTAQFYRGTTVLEDGTRVLLLDSLAVLEQCPLNDLSDKAVPIARDTAPDEAATQNSPVTETHVVFSAEITWAIGMRYLKEIMPVPANFKPAPENERGLIGTCEWRGNYLPVLGALALLSGDVLSKKLIVVSYAGKDAGILVNDILELLSPHRVTQFSFTPPHGALVRMLTIQTALGPRSYRNFDLAALPFFRPE